ncbi:hypothetical protein RND71_036503 [Anisodus tanguticus]|uniref:Uncharacterized protein n=1 Tax=Anisodus tanguticus TaxID=243964 RepID=A0AAE1R0M3_9SOLA|nr:hypothetical protein RND71_036503 [Anisodus tanguticus]
MASRKSNNIPCNNIYVVASVEGDRTGSMTRSMLRSSGIDKDKYFISLETPEKSKSSTMGATSRVLYQMRLLNQNPTLTSSRVDVIQLERSERTQRIRLLQPWSTLWFPGLRLITSLVLPRRSGDDGTDPSAPHYQVNRGMCTHGQCLLASNGSMLQG